MAAAQHRSAVVPSAAAPAPAVPSDDAGALRLAAETFHLEFDDLRDVTPDAELFQIFPSAELFRRCLAPLSVSGNVVRIATCDPLDWESLDELNSLTGYLLHPVLAPRGAIEQLLKAQLGLGGGTVRELIGDGDDGESATRDLHEVDDASQASSVIKLVNEILLEAIRQRVSDIHLEPAENRLEVRYRIDGLLRKQPMPPEIHRFRSAILSRLKIMARLNIAEKRLPQDGRIPLTVGGREIDLRVSMMPMLHGEGAVLRLLDKSRGNLSLEQLQFPAAAESAWRKIVQRPHGMILVTGPTGSGKTSTLYSSLSELTGGEKKIVTIEDPVEYQLPGVNQIQVQAKIGLTFAAGLRGILRHDPDVILIGEIRDQETAVSAVQASLTGHLVLSTLHTNDAVGAIPRLIDMGIEPYLVAGTVQAVLAQRLVRRVCPACRTACPLDAVELPEDFPREGVTHVWQGAGCDACHGTGYAGRVGLFELLVMTPELQQLSARSASAVELQAEAKKSGMATLREHGWERVRRGETSVEEVLRVCAG